MLKEQMDFLHSSLEAFYAGKFAESLRIATVIRVLVHETGNSKPLLNQIRPDGLALEIPDLADELKPGLEYLFRFVVSVRLGSASVAPAVDLESSHYLLTSIGAWWNRSIFMFKSKDGTQVNYKRKHVLLTLANTEGGAHVDPDEDPDYRRLLTGQPLTFHYQGVPLRTPDLACFQAAQSGVEMLSCLKHNFFPDYEMPTEVGAWRAITGGCYCIF